MATFTSEIVDVVAPIVYSTVPLEVVVPEAATRLKDKALAFVQAITSTCGVVT